MAEINDGKGIKTIAYYLPQFHSIPENDRAWGKGFTEWSNTCKAQPMFSGHYQPKVPLNNNYYNLLDDDAKIWQAELAKKYNIFGFCYYHYWFKDGKMLLEKPAEQMLKNKNVDIPFCFSWANENWTKRWDGGNKEIIAEQDYGTRADWKKHLDYLIHFFKDSRYITLDGKPVFLIYKPEEMPKVNEMIDYWNDEIRKSGLPGISFMIQNPNWFFMPSYNRGEFSYQIKFQPFFALAYKGKNIKRLYQQRVVYDNLRKIHLERIYELLLSRIKKFRHRDEANIQKQLDYDEMWKVILESESSSEFIEGAFVDWDNTARKKNGYVHVGATPEKFGGYMELLFEKIDRNKQQPVIFLNAWNEWCEGAYLEPDEKHRTAYLEAFYNADRSHKILDEV